MSTDPKISEYNKSDYIEAASNEDLVNANRRGEIDARSAELMGRKRDYLQNWRRGVERSSDNLDETLTGLALSGGGIRSAIFALGVTQALAARDLMSRETGIGLLRRPTDAGGFRLPGHPVPSDGRHARRAVTRAKKTLSRWTGIRERGCPRLSGEQKTET
jgi:hypothetical protein